VISARTQHETWRPHLHRNLTAYIIYTSTLDANRRIMTHTVPVKCDYVIHIYNLLSIENKMGMPYLKKKMFLVSSPPPPSTRFQV